MMEEDDDDFYGAYQTQGVQGLSNTTNLKENEHVHDNAEEHEAQDDDNEGEDDEVGDDEDEDDVLFTLEKPTGSKTEVTLSATNAASSRDRAPSSGPRTLNKAGTPQTQNASRSGSVAAPQAAKGVPTYNGKEGKDFPELHTSTIDLDVDPIWPSNGRPITEMEIDSDLAEHSKPWRITGTDQTDYFNYGFDEYTWTMYCLKQQQMREQIEEQKTSEQQMKAALGITDKTGNTAPGLPHMPGPGGMGPMDMFNPEQMMQQMMAQGINPANLDFNSFMQMAGQMGAGPPGQNSSFGNQSGPFGSGQNSASPGPGQAFQPPSGPSVQSNNMEGYSQQQMAIMQEQQGQMGSGGGRGRGRRNRGYY